MAGISDIAWLLARAGYGEAGSAVTLSYGLAHDGRLLGALVKNHHSRLHHASKQTDLTRLKELLEYCKPHARTIFAALSNGQEEAARLLLVHGDFTEAWNSLDRGISDADVSSIAPLLREICARPDVSHTLALELGVQCGLLDIVASARDGAFEELGYASDDHFDLLVFVEDELFPRNAGTARLLCGHPLFSLQRRFELASGNYRAAAFPGAAEWVTELKSQLVGAEDTPENRDAALCAAAATGAGGLIVANLLARGAVIDRLDCDGLGLITVALRGNLRELLLLYQLHDGGGNNLFACVAAGLTACCHDLITRLNWVPNDLHQDIGCTLLSLACAAGDVKTVRMLLQQGADPDWPVREPESPDQHEPTWQDPWLMCLRSPRFLLRDKIGFDSFDDASLAAPLANRCAIVGLLASSGSRPSVVVVAEAALEGCADLLGLYISASSGQPLRRLRRSNEEGRAAVATAALPHASSKYAVLRLVEHGAVVDISQVAAACVLSQVQSVRPNDNVWDVTRCEVVTALLAAAPIACPLHVRDSQGRTMITLAALGGNVLLVRALLEAGADSSSTDATGQSALDLVLLTLASSAAEPVVGSYYDCYRFRERVASLKAVAQVLRFASRLHPAGPQLDGPHCGTKRRASVELALPES